MERVREETPQNDGTVGPLCQKEFLKAGTQGRLLATSFLKTPL